jgi:predicted nucleotidyltransferase
MKTTGIVCEYNPLTNGHLYHLQKAREETGADTVVCVMSGSFTQRAEAAVADKYLRAEVAVRSGADMVVELPVIYAVSPAENFAYGAIKILSCIPGLECISFGSECGDVSLIQKAAELLSNEPEEFKNILQENLKEGQSYPRALSGALGAYATENPVYADLRGILDAPNNVLAIAYVSAVKKLNLDVKLHTVKRIGDYNDTGINTEYPSASAIRQALYKGELHKIQDALPPFSYNLLSTRKNRPSSLGDMILYKIKTMDGYELEKYYDISEGLHNRLKLAALKAQSYEELLEAAKTKKYTLARLKRLCLYAFLDITQEMYDNLIAAPPLINILAVSKGRKDLLSALDESAANVMKRYGERAKLDKSLQPLVRLTFRADGLLNVINKSGYYNQSMLLI